MAESDESIRAKVDQAMIYAPNAWLAQATRIAEAYSAAYDIHKRTLKNIEEQIRLEREFALALLNMVLPAFVGGAVGAIFAGKGRQLVETLAKGTAQFWGTAAVDVTKTVLSDSYKTVVRTALEKEVFPAPSSWEPSAVSPAQFMGGVQGAVYEYSTAVKDVLNRSKLGKLPGTTYRHALLSIYHGPFVRVAPETEELWPKEQITAVMEIFLWAHWAHHRDTKYWLNRISFATEKGFDAGGMMNELAASGELKRLEPILARLKACGVNETYVTQSNMDLGGRFLNILWVRHLDNKYPNTFLGELLARLKSGTAFGKGELLPAPRTIRLM